MKKVLIDFNGTLEDSGKPRKELVDWIRKNSNKAQFFIWSNMDRHAILEFLEENGISELFADILSKFTRVPCDIVIDDEPLMLQLMKKFAKKEVHISDFSALKDSLL